MNPPAPDEDESSQPIVGDQAAVDRSDLSSAASVASQAIQNREDRIAELRQAYLSGSYRPDPAKVAAKIVDEHIE